MSDSTGEVGVIGYDSIREHLAECVMNAQGLEENTIHMDVYIDIKILLRDWFEKDRRSK